jgi:YD repeat-containing protein
VDPDLSVADYNYYTGDFNGDKKDDVLEVYKFSTTSKLKVFYNFGEGIYVSEINEFPKSSVNQDFFSQGDFNGDGQKDIFYYDYNLTSNYVRVVLFHKDEKKDMITCIANGLSHKTTIVYERLNAGGAFYTKGPGAQFPVTDYNGAYYAVWNTVESTGVSGGTSVTNYNYERLRLHKQGKGSLGFWKVTTTDDEISFRSVKEYTINNNFYFSYLSKITLSLESGSQIRQNNYSYATKSFGNKRFFPYQSFSSLYDNLTDFLTQETYQYDDYGNLLTHSAESRSGTQIEVTKSETLTYGSYGSYDNIPNKILTYTLNSVYSGQPSYSRTKSYTYDSSGHLLTEKLDPSTSKETIETYSQFSSYGLPLQVTLSGSNVTSRTTVFEYDPKYRFIKKVTNPAGHYTSKTFDPGTGNVLTETNIINKTTTYQYDVFGRLTQTILPTLKKVNNSIGWDNSQTGGSNSLYYQSVTPDATTPGIPDVYTYYDLLGREIFSSKEGPFNNIYQKKVYNTDGTLNKTSWPYKTGETEKWLTYSYDNYGREISENNNGLTTTISYNLGSTTVTNPASQVKTTKVNSAGDVIRVTENNGNIIDYLYHSSKQIFCTLQTDLLIK